MNDITDLLIELLNKETFLVLGLIILNTLNLIFFSYSNNLLLVNGLLLLIFYFCMSNRKDKKILFLSILHFSFYGVLFESLIIRQTNLLKYKSPDKPFNLPLWLIPIYCSFAIGALYTYNIFKILCKA